MKTYNFAPNTPDWHAHRNSGFWNASDAPAMMGCQGAHSTRDQLLNVYKYRIPQEVSEHLQRKFDDGHRFEELARPIAEVFMADDLYPVIGSNGNLSASFDGLTRSNKGWEHKSLNNEIRAAFAAGTETDNFPVVVLPLKYQIQMEHQMLVSSGDSTLFSATKWNGDECTEHLHCWYQSIPELGANIVAGWHQFKLDLDAMPSAEVVPDTQMTVIGRAIDTLPTLKIRLAGMVTLTENNIAEYRDSVRSMLRESNVKPETDQDFANADKRVKFAGKAEDDLLNAENSLLSETGSVAAVISDLRAMRSEFREFRLAQEKYLTARKDSVRSEMVSAGIRAFAEFKADLFDACAQSWPIQSRFVAPEIATNFPGCIKGLRTIETMQSAVNTELANAKIAARALFEAIIANIDTAFDLNRPDLWPDLLTLVRKPCDDFAAILKGRIADADKAEAERIEAAVKAEAARIAQAAADAQAKAAAEYKAQERAIQQQQDEAAHLEMERVAARALPEAIIPRIPCSSLYQPDCPELEPQTLVTVSAPAPLVGEVATINIGDINERLCGVTIRASFLESKGFPGFKKGSWIVYLESDWPRIKEAIIEHLRGVK